MGHRIRTYLSLALEVGWMGGCLFQTNTPSMKRLILHKKNVSGFDGMESDFFHLLCVCVCVYWEGVGAAMN